MVTDNDFVADLAATSGKTLFGASVHPYRGDALEEMDRLIEKGACLVKWLPSAQNIQPDHPRCFPFYDLLAKHHVPLLSHTGAEHTLKAFPDSLSDPRRLVPALERGVTVIAAHCGTSLFLHEKSHFRAWQEMALQHENFYGDISAFGVITRIWRLGTFLRSPALAAKCVFGSDFPVPPWPLSCLGKISLRETLAIRRTRNYFDQSVALMKAAGVTDEIFARAGELLRVPDRQSFTPASVQRKGGRMKPQALRLPWTSETVPHAVLDILRGCNIRCRDCYNLQPDHIRPLAEIEAQLDALMRLRRLHSVSLVGGEITLHPELIEIVQSVRQRGLFVELFTNGVALNDDLLARLKQAGANVIFLHIETDQRRQICQPDPPSKI